MYQCRCLLATASNKRAWRSYISVNSITIQFSLKRAYKAKDNAQFTYNSEQMHSFVSCANSGAGQNKDLFASGNKGTIELANP